MSNEYSKILLKMMTMINQIKLYHWQTLTHPVHVVTDKLHEKLNILVDKFIETLTGRIIIYERNKSFRINLEEPIVLKNKINGYEILLEYTSYLQSTELLNVISKYPELLNIRDEMLSELNQTSYLFSLK